MDRSESSIQPPSLPRKRKALSSHIDDRDEKESETLIDSQISLPPAEISSEELEAFEKSVKEMPSEVEIDLKFPSLENRVSAPIIEDYIDPFTVPPLKYLLEQAQAAIETDAPESDFSPENEQEDEK